MFSSGGTGAYSCWAQQLRRAGLVEGQLAREHLEQDDAGGVDIRSAVARFGARLLGRHVLRRPDDHAVLGLARLGAHLRASGALELRDPEVQNLDELVLPARGSGRCCRA